MPIFRQELRRQFRKRKIMWLAALLVCAGALLTANQRQDFLRHLLDMSGWNAVMFVAALLRWLAVIMLAPAMTAGLITGERERGTLEMLLLTRLGTWSIVLQKYLAAVLPVIMFSLLFLPLFVYDAFVGYPLYAGYEFTLAEKLTPLLRNEAVTLLHLLAYGAIGLLFGSLLRRTSLALAAYPAVIFGLVIPGCFLAEKKCYQFWYPAPFAGLLIFLLLVIWLCLFGSVLAVGRLHAPLR